MLLRYLLILLSLSASMVAMQPPQKSPTDMLTGAAGAGNIKGLNYWIITQKTNPNVRNSWGRTPLSLAAGNGQLEAVQFLLNKGAQINLPDLLTPQDQQAQNGPTPLSWAVQFSNKTKTLEDYLNVIKLLISKGANVNHSAHGITILHNAARGGNEEIIKLILDNGARNSINAEGAQDKGRTPLAEAIRASKDAITHVDLENNSTATRAEFPKLLTQAITELHAKEQKKLSTDQIIKVINILKRYGARTDIADALGHKLDYYINEVQLVSDAERAQLLQALNFKLTPRTINHTPADLPQAISRLENLRDVISTPAIAQKISMVIWTLQEVQRTSNTQAQYDTLRVAMALLSKVKEIANAGYFADLEDTINQIRTILRDSALIVSKKSQAAAIPPKPAPTTTPTSAPQPPRNAEPKPAPAKPAAQPQSAQAAPVYREPLDGILITTVQNNYNQPATVYEIFDYPGAEMELPEHKEKESTIAARTQKSIGAPVGSRYDFIRVDTDKDSLFVQVNIDKNEINIAGRKYPISQYKLSTISIDTNGKITMAPYQAPQQPTGAPKREITLHVNSMYITDLLNYSDKPAKLTIHFKASGTNKEYLANPAKSKTTPTTQEVMRAGHADAPITIESFNQKATLDIIPGDPAKPGKVTEVKKQIVNSKEPIKYWRLSDVKQVQIVITQTGEIKIVPVKKINIIDYQGK